MITGGEITTNMSLLISLVLITAILVISPSATISAFSLCCLLSLAYLSGAIRFNRPTELNALPAPAPQPGTEGQKRLISGLVRLSGRKSDDNRVQGELTWGRENQSPGVITLARGTSLWRQVTSGPPAAGYPIQILYDSEDADIEYVGMASYTQKINLLTIILASWRYMDSPQIQIMLGFGSQEITPWVSLVTRSSITTG
jgi:hypothetical protein